MPHSTSAGNGDAMRILPQQQPDSIKRVAHRLPCTIHADGDLPTARAFCPMPDPLQSFRGRLLTNATFTIPADSQLLVVEQIPTESSDPQASSYRIKHHLERDGIFYLHDDMPTKHSPVPAALNWLSISSALHSHVTPAKSSDDKSQDTTEK